MRCTVRIAGGTGPIDESRGDCFGHTVPADMPADECPKRAFEPRE